MTEKLPTSQKKVAGLVRFCSANSALIERGHFSRGYVFVVFFEYLASYPVHEVDLLAHGTK